MGGDNAWLVPICLLSGLGVWSAWLAVQRATRLRLVLVLNLILVGGLVYVGISAHSLGVFAEGADYLADAGAIGVALLALWLARRPSTATRPYGYPKATALAALVNAGWLLVLTLVVIAGAIERLAAGSREVQGVPVLVVSGIAAAAMVVGAFILGGDVNDLDSGDENSDLTMRAVLLDTVADAAAAAGVAITGAVIAATGGLYWLDPAVALAVSGVVAYHAVGLLRRVAAALRAADPQR
jgi:cobalt-zinc-cadmium efflux system protein